MNRSVAVMRMHLADPVTLVLMPAAIVAASYAINLLIWAAIGHGGSTGGGSALHVFMCIVAVYAVIRGLPFALGMGATRRAFVGGTTLTGLVLALGFGSAYVVLAALETSTDGWGLGGHFFWFAWFSGSSWITLWLLSVFGGTAAFTLGQAVAAVYARWKMPGMAVLLPSAVLVIGGAVALISWRRWWGAIGDWFGDLTPLAAAGWLAVLTIALIGISWLVLRRVRL